MAAGRPVAELAEELRISTNLLYSWRSTSQGARIGSEGLRAVGEEAAADDPRTLRRESALLRQENDILKKAAVILGTKPQPNFAR
jgi:transposase-like protein